MSDLVERLRKRDKTTYDLVKMLDEAADEIEHLQADLQFSYQNKAASDDTWRKECERLRTALEEIIDEDYGLRSPHQARMAEIACKALEGKP